MNSYKAVVQSKYPLASCKKINNSYRIKLSPKHKKLIGGPTAKLAWKFALLKLSEKNL